MTDAYTYFIGWSKLDRYYYGCRWANKVPPEKDLWVHYFTSSDVVRSFREEHGEPDIVKVQRTFTTGKEARTHETKVLQLFNVVKDDRWLNRHDRPGPPTMVGPVNPMYRRRFSDDHRQKLSKSVKKFYENNPDARAGKNHHLYGKQLSDDHKRKLSIASKMFRKNNPHMFVGENNHRYGKHLSDETKRKISERNKQSKKFIIDGVEYKSGVEACKAFGVSRGTLNYRIKAGTLKKIGDSEYVTTKPRKNK